MLMLCFHFYFLSLSPFISMGQWRSLPLTVGLHPESSVFPFFFFVLLFLSFSMVHQMWRLLLLLFPIVFIPSFQQAFGDRAIHLCVWRPARGKGEGGRQMVLAHAEFLVGEMERHVVLANMCIRTESEHYLILWSFLLLFLFLCSSPWNHFLPRDCRLFFFNDRVVSFQRSSFSVQLPTFRLFSFNLYIKKNKLIARRDGLDVNNEGEKKCIAEYIKTTLV